MNKAYIEKKKCEKYVIISKLLIRIYIRSDAAHLLNGRTWMKRIAAIDVVNIPVSTAFQNASYIALNVAHSTLPRTVFDRLNRAVERDAERDVNARCGKQAFKRRARRRVADYSG
jgi:hypothetical protein